MVRRAAGMSLGRRRMVMFLTRRSSSSSMVSMSARASRRLGMLLLGLWMVWLRPALSWSLALFLFVIIVVVLASPLFCYIPLARTRTTKLLEILRSSGREEGAKVWLLDVSWSQVSRGGPVVTSEAAKGKEVKVVSRLATIMSTQMNYHSRNEISESTRG